MPTPVGLPEQLGRYRILQKLGEGGMGAVYLAEDTELGRRVALKVPHFSSEDGAAVERFKREARIAAGLSHPNLCGVYDVGQAGGLPTALGHGLPTVPRRPTEGLLLFRETFGRGRGHGRETVPQPRAGGTVGRPCPNLAARPRD